MKRLLSIAALMLMFANAEAKLSLSRLCSDGAVLQQNTEATIWGTADPGAQITVTPSWGSTSFKGKADQEGKWSVKVKTPAASYKAYTITVKGGGTTVRMNDILVGEVWLASGQSNMEMPMRGFFNCPVENAIEYISAPAAQYIRH